jgi:hypothetical protein
MTCCRHLLGVLWSHDACCFVAMIFVSHHDDTLMTGPSPVVSHKTKRDREKEPYSDDESDKLDNNGG